MFSCRPRVELVAAGSRSPCVSIEGDKSQEEWLAPHHRHTA